MARTAASKVDATLAGQTAPLPETIRQAASAKSKVVPAKAAKASDVDAPAVWKKPSDLTPWSKNPKPLEAKHVREMKRSIRRFGFGAPIVARAANLEIIEGHLRHAAATALRLERVPVRLLDISEDEAHMLAIAAWKFEHRRDANEAEVAAILDDLEERGVDLEHGTGFDDKEIDKILAKADAETAVPAGGAEPSDVRGHKRRPPGSIHRIVIECEDEAHQLKLLEQLAGEGLSCKPLT